MLRPVFLPAPVQEDEGTRRHQDQAEVEYLPCFGEAPWARFLDGDGVRAKAEEELKVAYKRSIEIRKQDKHAEKRNESQSKYRHGIQDLILLFQESRKPVKDACP
ncbi:MAG: hypothetical protein A4E59_01165 [Syntrophorhabdus sp. PtaB.Bin027]|nr:MAG: hypothetical protein A4E59_01165 [Syntrophorhabdus sp. PtaB.Bin027]